MAACTVSKEEYLKRYLSQNAEEKKKKKKKKHQGVPAKVVKSRIVDDDVDLKSLLPENLENTLEEDVGDNDPLVAEYIDDRPEDIKLLEKYRTSGTWRVMGDGEGTEKSQKKRFSNSTQQRQRHDSDSDQSVPRRQRHDSDSDQSPPRRQRHDSDSDQSLPRRQRHGSDSDQSPPRRQRHDSDESPPRKKQYMKLDSKKHQTVARVKNDEIPEKTSKKTDFSNSRKRKSRFSSLSPQNKIKSGSEYAQSPPRRKRHDFDSDQSPPRRKQESDSDQSPPRRRKQNSDSDQSPPRRREQNSDSDQSPPRRNNSNLRGNSSEKSRNPEKTLSGKKAGLSSAKDMRKEAEELRRKEDAKFNEISNERLGRGAATVFRDKKSGRKRDLHAERDQETREAQQKAKEDEKFKKWGKGLKQLEDQKRVLEEALHETEKPLARHKDDEDLDKMLREMDRAEDPMLAFIKKKKKSTGPPVKEKPRYKGPAPPPNRFGILPGYRWDGVDRSNGFEKQIFAKQSESRATASAAYKWSVEDM